MRRHELTDEAWVLIEPLPAPGRMGRTMRDRRQVVNGILWKLSTGAAWRDLPEHYGPWKTVYERFRLWSADGTWDRLPAHVQQHSDAVGAVDWTIVCVDSTTVRAQQHAAGAPKQGQDWPGEALGRPRGGLTSKIHLACDGQGRPLAFTLTGGNVNDCTQFEPVMDRIRINGPGPGRPRTRPGRVAADKGDSARKIRAYLRRRGIACTIPERIDQINGRLRRGESLCRLDRTAYRRRNTVERCFSRLKQNPALATRYDKRARHYQAEVTLACLTLWLP
ncbi:IS5 family transposase [Streptomyces sp. B-S-A6]|uniref:IS5 family transposase n=1 Tax=Streptomyces cavernicola TaxID=3043613 RepID=A0ABT6S564_9ACTN|nr:IS5 family transposase [Streptomyces sp. B-S-A6]MDI3403225.1 IS5 family transposase [Streptomyces sp. B-S-A6]